jgi:transposase-like protein
VDFPIADLMDEGACYLKLLAWLHPDGLRCPGCAAEAERYGVHRRCRDPVTDYRCRACGRVFNAFTGTAFARTTRSCARLVLIVRGVAQGRPTAELARELGCARSHLLELRHRLQANAAAAVDRSVLAADARVEADEMYQAAGEKRPPPRRPGRPAAPPGQRGPRAGQLGPRPPARARDRRASDPRAAAGRAPPRHA